MTIDVRAAATRFATEEDGRTTFHSFSFGAHYDPADVGFAAMVAHNDENLGPGTGYAPHPHRDVEIVTWVLDGALRHTDDRGGTFVLGPGEVLRTSAGSGIVHSEMAEPGVPTRFLQTWLRPDEAGRTPSLARAAVGPPPGPGGVEIVGPGGLDVGTAGARLLLGGAGDLMLPDAPRLHLFVVGGEARIGERALMAGDAARLVEEGGRTVQIGDDSLVAVWAFVA